jgi:hypothetical protein
MTSEHSESTYSGRMKDRFAEIQTRLRKQMVMIPKPLVFAGMLPLSNNPAHMLSTAKALPTPMHLLLALASVGITWVSASWWKQRRTRNAAARYGG